MNLYWEYLELVLKVKIFELSKIYRQSGTLTIVEHTFIFGVHHFYALSFYRLLTGSILAHELMHGWLRLKGEAQFFSPFSLNES